MFRLMSIKTTPMSNSRLLRLYKWGLIDGRDSRMFSGVNKRLQSTKQNTELSLIKKKKRRTKYTELLQVSDMSTKQIKTKVKNLKNKKLSDFIETSGEINQEIGKTVKYNPFEYEMINFDLMDNPEDSVCQEKPLIFVSKEVKDPENKNRILTNLKKIMVDFESSDFFQNSNEKVADSEILDEELDVIPDELDTLNVKSTNISHKSSSESKEHRFRSKLHVSAEQERQARTKSLIINLTSYIKVCVSSGMVNRGYTTLLMYRQKHRKTPLTIDVYNILLHGYAEKGIYTKIKEILNLLKQDEVKLNHQSFAAIFECLGRLEADENNIKELHKYSRMAKQLGMDLNEIMDKSKFHSDQRKVVLDAIHRIEPNFQPEYSPPPLFYNNPLLSKLNEESKINNDNVDTEKMFSPDQLRELAKEQLKIELEGSITIKSIAKSKGNGNSETWKKKLDELYSQWRVQICTAINRDLNILKAQTQNKPYGFMTYFTYMKALNTGQYADILLKEIKMLADGSETYSPTVGQLYRDIGNKVKTKYFIEQKKKTGVLEKIESVYSDYCNEWQECNSKNNPRQIWQRVAHSKKSTGPNIDIEEVTWSSNVCSGVGKFLYNILMKDIKIDVNIMREKRKKTISVPAFYTLFRNHGRVIKEEVKPHPVLMKLIRASHNHDLTFDANLVPMLCPPQPWSSPVHGGYLVTKSELIRLPHQAIQQWERVKEINPQELYPALDSLNQLSSIPWKVNTDILDVILEVFNNGGDEKLDIPQPSSSLPPLPLVPESDSDLSKVKKYELFQKKLIHKRKQAEMYSLWCDALYRLSLANHYRNKVFWLPHNMDFRGRVYPIPPHLNHLGSDMARSILVFNQAKPLGIDGFTWLKLHCINLTGFKKRDSIRERIIYAEEVMDEILDSADNPLTGRRWWAKSDEPWQTLACCMEIAKVKRSPNPEEYMSHFPIHQDGSCNGLQHYAALGRDKAGAFSVNLIPSDVPQDVYSAVATLVEKCRKADEKNGSNVAKALKGYVRRKVIKQTVMTTVYGVTRYGARQQIAKQLKDIDEFPKEWVWPSSVYLTSKTFECLREMFTSTKEIQDWFTECARFISNTCLQNVEWVTPMGLPIVQPYNNIKYEQSRNGLSRNSLKVNESISMDMYEKPNTMKQRNAFPPNFIHSLDSSHMMLTSLYCEREGITFISVHDCFWTHACTVPIMNKVCREQFVALHSQPILEDLSKFLVAKYGYDKSKLRNDGSLGDMTKHRLNKILKSVPKKGDFDLNNVLNSVYFFS